MRKPRAVSGFALKWAGACAPWLGLALLAPVAQAQAQEAAAPLHETLQTYCIKCHNSEDWAGSLDLDAFSLDQAGNDPEVWEKAIVRLRGRLVSQTPGLAWVITDNLRIGLVYAVVLEAFKLGS